MKKQKHSILKYAKGSNHPIFVFDRSKIERVEKKECPSAPSVDHYRKKVEPKGPTSGVFNEKDSQRLLPDSY